MRWDYTMHKAYADEAERRARKFDLIPDAIAHRQQNRLYQLLNGRKPEQHSDDHENLA